MDIEFIVGIIISFVLTVWGIWNAEKSELKVHLTLIDREWISIINTYDDKEKVLQRIDYILPYSANQYYYHGTLINSGNTDIYKELILKPLRISLTANDKLLKFNIISTIPGIEPSYSLNENSVIIEWNILKPYEHFSFEMIFESSNKSHPVEAPFYLDYRIVNLNQIDKLKILEADQIKQTKTLREYFPTYLFLTVLLFFSGCALLFGFKSFREGIGSVEIVAQMKNNNEPVTFKYYCRDSIEIVHSDKVRIIAIDELAKNVDVIVKTKVNKNRYLESIIAVCLFLFSIYAFYQFIKIHLRDIKIRKIATSLNVQEKASSERPAHVRVSARGCTKS